MSIHQHLREELIHRGLVPAEDLAIAQVVSETATRMSLRTTNGSEVISSFDRDYFVPLAIARGPRNDGQGIYETGSKKISLCFETPVCGDLLYRGRKVAGSALRAWREGLLIQGSIQGLPIRPDDLIDSLDQAVGLLVKPEHLSLIGSSQ
jgi:hypothetical protein